MNIVNIAAILLGLILARVAYVALPGSPAWSAIDAVLIGFPAYALACCGLCALCRGASGRSEEPDPEPEDELAEDAGQHPSLFI